MLAPDVDAGLVRADPLEGDGVHFLSPSTRALPRSGTFLSDSREAEERTEPCGEDSGAERSEVVVEVAAFRDDDAGVDPGPCAAPGEALRSPLAFHVVVTGDDQAGEPLGRDEGAEAACGESGRRRDPGRGAYEREHGLDPLPDQERSVGGA